MVAGARELKRLLEAIVKGAEGGKAKWTKSLRSKAKRARKCLMKVPCIGEYNQAKIVRILLHWYLIRHEITFPPGNTKWYNWDTMSSGQPGKLKALKVGGVDTSTPAALVLSIQRGGSQLPAAAARAADALARALRDYELGCLLCEFGSFYQRMTTQLKNDTAIHSFLHHLLTSEDDCPKFLRENGVNPGLLSLFLPANSATWPEHASLSSSDVVTEMKAGALVKYFEALSTDHGLLVPGYKWLDPWIIVNMLLQLFKPTIKGIKFQNKARALQMRVQAQALLREAEEEEEDEAEEEEEDDVQFVRRKSSAKIPKKQKQKKLRTPTQLAAALKTAADRESAKVNKEENGRQEGLKRCGVRRCGREKSGARSRGGS